MKNIKKIFALTSIVVGLFLSSCTFSTLEGDDPWAYNVQLLLEEYNVECIVGTSCKPEDIRSDNEGFWIRNLDLDVDLSYQVVFDADTVDDGYISNWKGEEFLIPISDQVCQTIPRTIIVLLESPDKSENKVEINFVRK
ncbi:MAG: hypothetical protein GXP45_01845 [bacterium]|nr:hypothetical protein [bacterium]